MRQRKKYKIRKNRPENGCRISKCGNPHRARGLCDYHYRYFRETGRIDEYGLEPQKNGTGDFESMVNEVRKLRIKNTIEHGVCMFRYCRGRSRRLGICHKHYILLHRNGFLNLFKMEPIWKLECRK